MSKIVITGATGHLGKLIVNQLLQKVNAAHITVLVRDPSKAADLKAKGITLITGDYNNYASLVSAFQGIDKLYFVSSSDVMNRYSQQENVVKAAIEAKVGHIFYTSFQRKTEDNSSPIAFVAAAHLRTEKLIRESGLVYTILKHALYTDILPMFIGNQVLETGVIYLPAGNGKTSFATRNDMANVAVAMLTGSGHENKTYEIAGNISYSFNDIANILSELAGKPIQYISPSVKDFSEQLANAGVPAEGIQGVTTFCAAIEQGEFDFPDPALEKLIGRPAESVKDFLKTAYNL